MNRFTLVASACLFACPVAAQQTIQSIAGPSLTYNANTDKLDVAPGSPTQIGGYMVSTGLQANGGALSVNYGTTAGTAAQGNDPRIALAATAVQPAAMTAAIAQQVTAALGSTLSLGGGTLVGPLVLSANPGVPMGAATKKYVDDSVAAVSVGTGAINYTATAPLSVAGANITISLGTAPGTVAAGNDSRIVGALQAGSNLSDIGSPSLARANLGLNTAATLPASAFDPAGSVAAEQTRAQAMEATLAPVASPILSGTPTAPTAAAGVSSGQIATTAFTTSAVQTARNATIPNAATSAPLCGTGSAGTAAACPATAYVASVAGYIGAPTAAQLNAALIGNSVGTSRDAGAAIAAETAAQNTANNAQTLATAAATPASVSSAVASETSRAQTTEATLTPKTATFGGLAIGSAPTAAQVATSIGAVTATPGDTTHLLLNNGQPVGLGNLTVQGGALVAPSGGGATTVVTSSGPVTVSGPATSPVVSLAFPNGVTAPSTLPRVVATGAYTDLTSLPTLLTTGTNAGQAREASAAISAEQAASTAASNEASRAQTAEAGLTPKTATIAGLQVGSTPTAAQLAAQLAGTTSSTLAAGNDTRVVAGGTALQPAAIPSATTTQLYGGTGSGGAVAPVTLGTGLSMSGSTLNATGSGGGATIPSATPAQVYVGTNAANSAAAQTISGDASLATSGALTVTKLNGQAVSLAAPLSTSGANPLTMTTTGTTAVTLPTSGMLATVAQLASYTPTTATLAGLTIGSNPTAKQIASSLANQSVIAPSTTTVGTSATVIYPAASVPGYISVSIGVPSSAANPIACTSNGITPVIGTSATAYPNQLFLWPTQAGGAVPAGPYQCIASAPTTITTEAH